MLLTGEVDLLRKEGEGRGGGGLDEWNRDWRLGECRCRFRSEGGELASDPRKVD